MTTFIRRFVIGSSLALALSLNLLIYQWFNFGASHYDGPSTIEFRLC